MPARLAAHMIQGALNIITASGAALLLEGGTEISGSSQIGLWITVIASTAGVVTAVIKWRSECQKAKNDREQAEREHEWDESRRAEDKKEQEEYRAWVREKLTQNTDLTRETQQINVAALDAANSVNEKIEKIATIAARTKSDPMAKDTNETAHRIEDKL